MAGLAGWLAGWLVGSLHLTFMFTVYIYVYILHLCLQLTSMFIARSLHQCFQLTYVHAYSLQLTGRRCVVYSSLLIHGLAATTAQYCVGCDGLTAPAQITSHRTHMQERAAAVRIPTYWLWP